MPSPEHDATTLWVTEQLRYPQRLPRTTLVLDWGNVPDALQQKLEDVARAHGAIDYRRLPRRRWLRNDGPTLTTSEHQIVAAATTELQWPANVDSDETRLLTVVEGIVDRIADHPAWTQSVLGGRRSVIALHMELHSYATAANELLRLRWSTPQLPSHTDPESYVRQEWDRRQVAFAHSRSALVERAVALRVVEAGLDRVHELAEELRTIDALAADAHVVDGLYRNLAGAEISMANAHLAAVELDAAAENLRAQLSCLYTFGR